jgi:multiple sugar transport system ATP-binding protein
MKEGVVQQFDTPDRIYHYPANLFVADFIGNPKVNLLDGEIRGRDCVDLGGFVIHTDTYSHTGKVVLGVRPEDIIVSTQAEPEAVEFNAYSILPAGADTTIVARKGEVELTIRVMGISKIQMDDKIWLRFDPATLNLYHKDDGKLLTS